MKLLTLLTVLTCTLFTLPALAEEKVQGAKPEAEQEESVEIVSVGEVSKQMAEIWCQKLEECAGTSQMGPKECRKVLKKSFSQGFKNTPKGQKVEVTQVKLNQCSKSIKQDTCSALKSAQTLPGCEFIALLNRH